MSPKAKNDTAAVLTRYARSLGDVETGVACAGTVLESRTFKVHGKAFLFLGSKDARLKLTESVAEATSLAGRAASAVRVGTNGWTTISLVEGSVPDSSVLRRWVAESHAAFGAAGRTKAAKPGRGRGASR